MKKLLFALLLLPVVAAAQVYNAPQPEIQLLRVELKKDTLFVYRHVRMPPHNLVFDQSWHEWNDREVYVVGRGTNMVLVATERAKIRKVKVDAQEEYW